MERNVKVGHHAVTYRPHSISENDNDFKICDCGEQSHFKFRWLVCLCEDIPYTKIYTKLTTTLGVKISVSIGRLSPQTPKLIKI